MERPELREAVELEVPDVCEIGILQHQLDQAIAKPLAAVRFGDDEVEYERLERTGSL